ncbi:MAG: hypothetical protein R2827_08800 [Bdellovibrionales bacterium]
MRRTKTCGYSVEQALRVQDLQESLVDAESIDSLNCFIPFDEILPHWPAVTIRGRDAKLLKNGQVSHDLSRRLNPEQIQAQRAGKTIGVKVMNGQTGHLLSILEARPSERLKIRKVFESSVFS